MTDSPAESPSSDEENQYRVTSRSSRFLRSLITKALEKSTFDKTPHKFVPEGIIDKLVTDLSVRESLRIANPTPEENELVEFIVLRAKKAFATTVSCKLNANRAMRWFKRNDIDDNDLPIKQQTDLWKSSDWRSDFYDEQWKFFAPIFSTIEYSHDLEEAHILPFVAKSVDSGRGSFGVVSRYSVHKNHLKPVFPNHRSFAVKEIQATEDAQTVAEHWEKEVKALRMMNELKQEHIVHFVTAFRRRKENGGEEHYLMFEWADGGNLRSLWKATPSPHLAASVVKDAIKQILGLARALEAAHNLNRTGASYRHGDLKPENILRFSGGGSIGTLKIGDWGEAKEHEQVTEMRPSKTTAKYGTRRYEAPEVETGVRAKWLGQSTRRRSRLYDIWAMGCITLEFIIWLLYGPEALNRFNQELGEESFYQIDILNGKKVARVHDTAASWMSQMVEDPRCNVGNTAIGDLLEFVRTALLVVKLPRRLGTNLSDIPERPRADSVFKEPGIERNNGMAEVLPSEATENFEEVPTASIPSFSFTPAEVQPARIPVQPEPEPEGHARCLATDFRRQMEHIDAEDEDESYWYIDELQRPSPAVFSNLSHGPPPVQTEYYSGEIYQSRRTETNRSSVPGLVAPAPKRVDYAPPELDENDWKFQLDNNFASKLFSALKTSNSFELNDTAVVSRLCARCSEFRDQLWSPGFSMPYHVETLRASANNKECESCILLWQTVHRNGGNNSPSVKFERIGPFLRFGSNGLPVLSIVRSPKQEVSPASDFQIGFIELPEAGSATHLGVLQHWLSDCDTHHTCRPVKRADGASHGPMTRLPTRLIDVGKATDSMVHLWETAPEDTGEWIALSHKWGDRHLSTTPENLQKHLDGLELNALPATFRDAVTVTRALGRRYLWIDSLCVIQGPDGDFRNEAKRMEEVYSGAYCVIAASNATDHYSGFLKDRNARDFVGMCREGKGQRPFYVCQTIDNFKEHVLDGALHRRGWVLQEHALARRTLFFTEHQTYFECRNGVRCETSTKMRNKLAAFLGDPDFPHILSDATQGEKILRYQKLYCEYSRLGLSKPYDRPTAIDGLQQRLLRTMRVRGGFGIFDEGVTRGLLRRSLLWRRGIETPSLSRIHFPPESVVAVVPSWSWMAYTGGIDYLQPDFGSFEWEDLQSPWSTQAPNNVSNTDPRTANITLNAKAREFDLGAAVQGEGELIFDNPGGSSQPKTLCVVLGKAKGSPSLETQRHYVLVVVMTGNRDRNGERMYERVGTGYLPGKCISPSGFSVSIQ
ncbi:Nn.00g099850.m01.CDS01 [Neocucurbitaria sp. VM-36]